MSPEFECLDMAPARELYKMISLSGNEVSTHAVTLNSLIESLVGLSEACQKDTDTEGSLLK